MRRALSLAIVFTAALLGNGASGQVAPRSAIWIAPLRQDQAVDLGEEGPGGVKEVHDCSPAWGAQAAIKRLLFQMGAPVEDWPVAISEEQCMELQTCVERLRARGLRGYVLGGQIASSRHQPSTVQMWLVDIPWGRVMLSSQRCLGCEEPAALARQASALAQRIAERNAPWMPLASLSRCSTADSAATSLTEDPASTLPAVPSASRRASVLLAIYGTKAAGQDRLLVRRTAEKTLGLLGGSARPLAVPVHPDAPRSALRPVQQDQQLLDIELLYGQDESSLTEARLRLSDAQHIRQSTIHCIGSDTCTPVALARQVQIHVAALVDSFDELGLAEKRETPAQDGTGSTQPALCLPVLQCSPTPKGKPKTSACMGGAARAGATSAHLLARAAE